MKILSSIIISGVLLFVTYMFAVIFLQNNSYSAIIAVAVAGLFYLLSYKVPEKTLTKVLIKAMFTGIVTFLLGLVGPLIFLPDANEGPLLGIFITGPLGAILGLFGWLLYERFKLHSKVKV
jgi:hypothetical protein